MKLSRLRLRWPMVLVLLLVGCAPATPPDPRPAAQVPVDPKPAVEQKATFGYSNLVDTLDPHERVLNARRYDLFDALVLPNEAGEPQPAIATSWKLLDPLSWEFTVRTDMKWHDGTPLTVDDVKFSYDRAIDPALRLNVAGRLPTLASTEVIDRQRVVVKTKQADPILLRRLSVVAIVPKAYLERIGPAEFAVKAIGSGPFRVKTWQPGQLLVLSAFDEHAFRKPILRELTIRLVPEASARVAGLQTGELDFANTIPTDQAERLKASGFETLVFAAGTSMPFLMDSHQGDKPIEGPTADKRVRQAINYAVDKESIAKQIFRGFTKPEGQLAQPETFGYNPNVRPYPYDPAKAKQLLAEAGYPSGFKIRAEATTVLPEYPAIGLLIQQNLKDVGIELEFQVIPDPAAYREKFYGIQPRPALLGGPINNGPAMDADFSINWFWSKQPPGTRHYINPDFDRAYEASQTEMDTAKRRELLQRAIAVMNEDPPLLYVVAAASIDLYAPKRLKGVSVWLERDPRFDKIERIG